MIWPDGLLVAYRANYRDLVRVAYLVLGSRAEAEEVVQDAVLGGPNVGPDLGLWSGAGGGNRTRVLSLGS